MTSLFYGDPRDEPDAPVALSPNAASKGGPDSAGPGIDLSFFLNLSASLGQLVDTMQAEHERRAKGDEPPADEQIFASGVVPASGVLILDLGSVPLGRVWQIRRLVCGASVVTSAVTGTAYVFAQGSPPADLNITNVCDILTPLPRGNTYGTHQFFLKATEHLWVVFSGATVGQQLTASSRVESFDAGTFRQRGFSE